MAHKLQFRRDTKTRWEEINPVLMEGELGLEIDTRNGKMGDGVHAWNDLEYNNNIVFDSITQELGKSEHLVVSQKLLTQEVENRSNNDNLLWNGIKNEADNRTKVDNQLLEKINHVITSLEEFPEPNYQHVIRFDDTENVVSVGDAINWPTEIVEWNPNIEKYNEEDTIDYEKYLECSNGDEIDWKTQENWSQSELGDNKFIITFNYPVGEYTVWGNIGSKKIIIVPPVSNGRVEKIVKVTYPWYIGNTAYLTPINETKVVTINLAGSPIIKIPLNSIVAVKANVGNGMNDVADWNFENDEIINGVKYRVYSKAKDNPYASSTPHQITVTIKV